MFAVFHHISPLIVVLVVGLITLLMVILFKYSRSARRPSGRVPKDTVLIYGVGRGVKAPSASPFPLKLETFCRMASIPYMVDHSAQMSSKGKTPWMEYNGVAVADSQFCIEHLKAERDLDLDSDLSPSLRAQAHAFRELAEENLYWTMCHDLFMMHPERVRLAVPYSGVKLWVLTKALRRVIGQQLWGQGIGRHTDLQIWDIARRDLDALSHFLGDNKFLCGDEPREVDCAVFGMLVGILYHNRESRHEQHIKEVLPNLQEYVDRMKWRFWPDWEQRCKGDKYVDDSYKLYNSGFPLNGEAGL